MDARKQIVWLLVIALAGLVSVADAASPTRHTAIYVDDMHCGECAKKIASRLYGVAGVVEVRANLQKNVAFVIPQKEKNVSPKAVWEAVEKAGFTPVRLEGPQGSFTKKPGV